MDFWSFLSGVIATLVGFVLTMAWDIWKTSRESKARSKAVVRELLAECEQNAQIAGKNASLLQGEAEILARKMHLVLPTAPFKSGGWEILRMSIPAQILADAALLASLREAVDLCGSLNEGMRSRQAFKDSSSAAGNFFERLELSDRLLIADTEKLQRVLLDAAAKLKAL